MTLDLDKDLLAAFKATIESTSLKNVKPKTDDTEYVRFSTGSYALDNALGGGIPRGTMVQYYGTESAGKSLLAALIIKALFEKQPDALVLYIDVEGTVKLPWWDTLGITADMQKRVGILEAATVEDVGDALSNAIDKNIYDLVILDSLAAMTSRAEMKGRMEDYTVGKVASQTGKLLRKIHKLNTTKTAILVINQIRDKMNVDKYDAIKYTVPGGKAPKFHSSIMFELDLKPIFYEEKSKTIDGKPKKSTDIAYNRIRGKIRKNKTAPPFRTFDIPFLVMAKTAKGLEPIYRIDSYLELLEVGRELGVFTNKEGKTDFPANSTWYFDGIALGAGQNKVITFLQANDDIFTAIETKLYTLMLPKSSDEPTATDLPVSEEGEEAFLDLEDDEDEAEDIEPEEIDEEE